MKDWEKVKEKNQERLERLNLPKFKSSGKVFILDKYCPYELDVFAIKQVMVTRKSGIHGTMAGQVVKVIAGDDVEFHGSGYTSDFNKIVDYCIENDIRVINSSIVCSYTKEKDEAIKKYAEWGGIWVSSAGNEDDEGVHYPGSSDYTICVSATNTEDSNGPEITVTADSYWYVRNLRLGMFHTFNGTSCSAPVIAGVVRLILDARPSWKLKEVVEFLKQNSFTDLRSLEENERFFVFPYDFTKEVEKMNDANKIIIHHSATDEGTYESIKRYHVEVKGWTDIGYHYLITKDGVMHQGRSEHVIGAHTSGENDSSLSVCLVGNFDNYKPTEVQLYSLAMLIKDDIWIRKGKLPLHGHNEYANKSCPGKLFPWKELIEMTKEHWAEKHFNSLNEKGIVVHEKRFDDEITRGEVMALLDRITDRITDRK